MASFPVTQSLGPTRRARPLVAAPPVRQKPDLLRIALSVLIVLSVSHIQQRFPYLEPLRPGLVFTALALGCAFLNPKSLADGDWVNHWPAKLVAGLLAASLASIAFGISQGGAWWFFSNYFWKVIVSALLLMASMRTLRDVSLFAWAYVIASAILVYMALFVFRMTAEANGVTRLSHLDTWDANDICVVLLVAMPFCLLFLRTSSTLGKGVAAVTLVGIGAAIARSGSRGGFIGLSTLLLAYLMSMKGHARTRGFLMVAVVAIALAFAAPSGYWKQMQTVTTVRQDYNYFEAQGRRQLAIRGMGYMFRYPLFGVGIGNFGRAEGTISSIAGMKGTIWSAPHNSYVQAGAELGIPGFILFAGLVGASIVVPWRMRKRVPAAWATGTAEQRLASQLVIYLPLSAVGFAVPAFFVSFAYLDPIYILAAMSGALGIAVDRLLRESTSPPAPDGRASRPGRGVSQRAGAPQAVRPARRPMRWAPLPDAERQASREPAP